MLLASSMCGGCQASWRFYFAALLPEYLIQQAFAKASEKWQGPIYTPAVLVWSFLSQILSADHGCRETVPRLIAFRAAQGQRP